MEMRPAVLFAFAGREDERSQTDRPQLNARSCQNVDLSSGSLVWMGHRNSTSAPRDASTQIDLVVLKQYVQQFDNQCVKELKR